MRKLLIVLTLSSIPLTGHALYFGAGTGVATVDIGAGGADRVDDEDNYFKGVIGLDIIDYLSIELGYIDFGEYSAHFTFLDETDTATASAFTVGAVGRFPATEVLTVFARLGGQFWSAEYEAEADFFGTPLNGSGDGSGSDVYAGVGIDLNFGKTVTLRLETEKYKDVAEGVTVNIEGVGSVETLGSDVDLFGVALIFKLE